jgi:anti-sigma B factor antagonist
MNAPQGSSGPVKGVRWVRKTAIVDALGDIDLESSPEFQQSLLAILDEKPKRIIVNLAQVGYMDSSGVATLVKLLSRARKTGASLALVGLTDRVRSIFEITRLDGIFEMFPSEKEANA